MSSPIDIRRLPEEFKTLVGIFSDLARENGRSGILSRADFEAAAKICKTSEGHNQDHPGELGLRGLGIREVEARDPRCVDQPLLFPRDAESPPSNFCEAYARLKQKLDIPGSSGCRSLFADATTVLGKLKEKIIRRRAWSDLEKFASLEYVGRVLATFIYFMEGRFSSWSRIPFSVDQTPGDKGHLTITNHGSRYEIKGRAPLGGTAGNPRLIDVSVSFDMQTLASGKPVAANMQVLVGGKVLPPTQRPNVLPYILEATGRWDYKFCSWALLDEGLILFDFNRSSLNGAARDYLDRLAKIIRPHRHLRLEIIGHADSSGAEHYNEGLGLRRAMAVRQYLVSKGIAPDRIEVVTEGESAPVDSSEDNTENAYNRNVQITAFFEGEEEDTLYYTSVGLSETRAGDQSCRFPTQPASGVR